MVQGNSRRAPSRPLILGTKMICPRCKTYRDILDYDRLEQNAEYEDETNAIYKCPRARGGCSYIFSPAPPSIMESMF